VPAGNCSRRRTLRAACNQCSRKLQHESVTEIAQVRARPPRDRERPGREMRQPAHVRDGAETDRIVIF